MRRRKARAKLSRGDDVTRGKKGLKKLAHEWRLRTIPTPHFNRAQAPVTSNVTSRTPR